VPETTVPIVVEQRGMWHSEELHDVYSRFEWLGQRNVRRWDELDTWEGWMDGGVSGDKKWISNFSREAS